MTNCKESCHFTLTDGDDFKICKNMCEMDQPDVDTQNAEADYDEVAPGEDMHTRTHLCRIHNQLRLERNFGYRMSKEQQESMVVTKEAPEWLVLDRLHVLRGPKND